MEKIKFINSNILKIFAIVLMLLDHMWGTIIPGNQWMTCIGRLAFPIFAFLIVEGFVHTSDFKNFGINKKITEAQIAKIIVEEPVIEELKTYTINIIQSSCIHNW